MPKRAPTKKPPAKKAQKKAPAKRSPAKRSRKAPAKKKAKKKAPAKPPAGYRTLRDYVNAYVDGLDLDPHGEALAALARSLAMDLDSGAGLAAAAVSKELRATLAELSPEGPDDETQEFLLGIRAVSPEVRDSKN